MTDEAEAPRACRRCGKTLSRNGRYRLILTLQQAAETLETTEPAGGAPAGDAAAMAAAPGTAEAAPSAPAPAVEEETVEEDAYECPECGTAITPDMATCPNCGVGLTFEDEAGSAEGSDGAGGATAGEE